MPDAQSKLKVLHVIPSVSPHRGGPSQVVLQLVKALRNNGIDAEIATTNDNGAHSSDLLDVPLKQLIEYQGVPVWFFPRILRKRGLSITKSKGFIFSWDLTYWLMQRLQEYDVLHAHYLFSYSSTYARVVARWRGVPYIARTMGQLAPWALAQSRVKKQIYSFLLERPNLNHAAAIHCTSAGEADDVRRFGVKTPTITLPLGVNEPISWPEAKQKLRHTYGISPDVPVVLFLSRLNYKKRPDLLVQALSQLATKQYNFHLIVAGSGEPPDYQNYLTNLVSSLGLASRTSFPGFVTGQDKDLLLQGADLFVLPSFSENFGVAVAEAMAAGLPVVITPDIQISPEIAAHNAGLVVPGEVEPLADAIAQLLASPEQRQLLGENGKRLASHLYSWDAIALHLTEVYRSIIDQKPIPTHFTIY